MDGKPTAFTKKMVGCALAYHEMKPTKVVIEGSEDLMGNEIKNFIGFSVWLMAFDPPLKQLHLKNVRFSDWNGNVYRLDYFLKVLEKTNSTLEELHFENSDVSSSQPQHYVSLADALKSCHRLKKLVINVPTTHSFKFFAACVKNLPALEDLTIKLDCQPWTKEGDGEGDQELVDALKTNTTIKECYFDMHHNNVEPYSKFADFANAVMRLHDVLGAEATVVEDFHGAKAAATEKNSHEQQ